MFDYTFKTTKLMEGKVARRTVLPVSREDALSQLEHVDHCVLDI